jgi:hypothetical protein
MDDRTDGNQQHRASGLNLLVTAIILWNTQYLERAIAALRQTEDIPDQLLDKDVDRLLHLRQAYAGMAQQGQLHGKAQAIGGAAAAHHEVLIGSGKDVMLRQGVRITRHAKEQLAFFVGKQRSTRH